MKEYFRPDYTPEWFHLENYEPLKDMDRNELHGHFMSSYIIFNCWATASDEEIQCSNFDSWFTKDFKACRGEDFFNINAIRTAEIFEIEDALNKKTAILDTSYTEGIEPADDVGYTAIIAVDLSCNDNKIIEDMEKWLKQTRKGNKKRLSDAKLKGNPETCKLASLIENKIFPCMDLLFWAKYKDIKYTNPQLINMLFPTEDIGEKKIREVRKTAMKYLTTKAYTYIL